MRDSVFGLAKESSFGTPVTTPTYFPPVETVDRDIDRETIEIEETIGNAFPSTLDYGTRSYPVTAEGAFRVSSAPRILSAFLGAPTTTTISGGTTSRSHTFEPVAKQLAGSDHYGIVPHTLYVSNKDYSTESKSFYSGALGNELTVSCEPNGFIRYSAGFIALAKDTSTAAPTVTTDVSARFTFDQLTVFADIDGGGENEIPVASFSATYSNNVDTDQGILGQVELYTLRPENRSAEITFSPREDIADWWLRNLLDDPERVKIRALAEGATIEGSIKFTLEFTIHHAEVTSAPANVDASSRQKMIEVTARAAYSTADTAFFSARVQNTVTSY